MINSSRSSSTELPFYTNCPWHRASAARRRFRHRAGASRRRSGGPSKHVLHLLAHPFQLGLELDHQPGHGQLVDLGAERVDLPADLLEQELEPTPDRLRPGCEQLRDLLA